MELKINELNELIYLNKIQINIYLEYNIVIKFQISIYSSVMISLKISNIY